MRFATPCLSICKESDSTTLEQRLDESLDHGIVDIAVDGGLVKNVVENKAMGVDVLRHVELCLWFVEVDMRVWIFLSCCCDDIKESVVNL